MRISRQLGIALALVGVGPRREELAAVLERWTGWRTTHGVVAREA